RRALVVRPDSPQALSNLAKACFAGGDTVRSLTLFQRLLQLAPGDSEVKTWLSGLYHQHGRFDLAAAMAQPPQFQPARRSVVVPVLDYSPGAPWNIRTLLDDLAGFDGEVAVVFNSPQVCEDLKDHPRIDKFCVNKHNVGVARGWNMGLNLAEGAVVFVLNADLHVTLEALERIEAYVLSLPDAVLVGVGGDVMEPVNFHALRSWLPGAFSEPVEVDRVSGYLFAIHAERFHDAGLSFDPRLSPYFHEETDIAFKIKAAGLKAYAVPVTGFGHEWGITASDRPISYFGRPVKRNDMLIRNGLLLRQKLRKKKE
ncbi:MAG: glycosyltransferase, partial [Rhodospirillales bacterium]|nr:glycosyltransferase [Rhodospirillales bacterium]